MENINITINKQTRMIKSISKRVLGNDGENLQENLIFSFEDEFVNGTARLELIMPDDTTNYLMLTKSEETYQIPVKSVMTKEGKITMQVVITEGTDDEEIPIFKSNTFFLTVRNSINAETLSEEDYPDFIDVAEAKLNAIDDALDEVENFDITASKSGTTTTVTITDRNGDTSTVSILDGLAGQNGSNGANGITPTIGDNGNWYLGDTDTGKPSRGIQGETGSAGSPGSDGVDGYSPSASISKSNGTATITITDKNGTTTASVSDGQDGQDGVSPSASVSQSGDTTTISITDVNGTTTASIDISGKLNANKVKSTYSTTSGDVYDVSYINSTIGDIETLLGGI